MAKVKFLANYYERERERVREKGKKLLREDREQGNYRYSNTIATVSLKICPWDLSIVSSRVFRASRFLWPSIFIKQASNIQCCTPLVLSKICNRIFKKPCSWVIKRLNNIGIGIVICIFCCASINYILVLEW